MIENILLFLAGIGAAIIYFTGRAKFKEIQFDESLKLRQKPGHDNGRREGEQEIRDSIQAEIRDKRIAENHKRLSRALESGSRTPEEVATDGNTDGTVSGNPPKTP